MPQESMVRDWSEMEGPPEARAAFIARLWLPKDDVERAMDTEKHLSAPEPEIRWGNFLPDWDLATLLQTFDHILSQPNRHSGYIGITTCPVWRWSRCEGHNDNSMRPHKDFYDGMDVIMVGYGEYIVVLEELAIEKVKEKHELENSYPYRSGPYNNRQQMFLYLCWTLAPR